jgi:hypothetical protein
MGESFSEDRAPITQEPIPGSQEIETDIRNIVDKYKGEELIKQLTSYCASSLIEVMFIKDPNPSPLWRLGRDKLELLGRLSAGL